MLILLIHFILINKRYALFCLMTTKVETLTHLQNFINTVENQLSTHLKVVRT